MNSETSLSEEFGTIRQKYVERIKHTGNENLANIIETTTPEKIGTENFIEGLKTSFPENKAELEALHEQVQKLESSNYNFSITEYDLNSKGVKTEIAKDYADFLVYEKNIKPVVIDGTTLFYKFDQEKMTWSEQTFEMIRKDAKKDLDQVWTRHFKNQFQQDLKDHPDYVDWEDFGLSEQKLLLKNGNILDIYSGEVTECEKDNFALNAVKANFVESPESEHLQEFIFDTFPNEDERKAIQEFLGFTLSTPSDEFEKALLILGPSNSGKSTFMQVLERFFAPAKTTNIGFPQLGQKRAFHISKLKHSILNFDHDMSTSSIDNYSRIKKLVSKESLFADPKRVNGFDMKSRANFVIASNNSPDSEGDDADQAFFNRFLTVQAPNVVPVEDRERSLIERLTAQQELDWLLQWALKGLTRLKEQNMFSVERTPYETKDLWSKYGNSVERFIHDQVIKDSQKGKNIPTGDVYEVYKMWCEDMIFDEMSRQEFVSKAKTHPDMRKARTTAFDGTPNRSCFTDVKIKDFQV